jgi:hypothetical protein
MQQINAKQMAELKALLASVGLDVKRKPKPKDRAAAWKPQTAAGRACKSAMLYWASFPPIEGIKSYQVRDHLGNWLSPDHPDFAAAVAYRKKEDAKPRRDCHSGNHR